jgi:O-antigen/teichoic acid export membrane protein
MTKIPVKNVLKYLSGSVVSQLLLIFAIPLLGSYYSSADVGVLSFILSVASPIGNVSTLAYHRAIMLPNNAKEIVHMYYLSNIISLLGTLLALVIIAFIVFLDWGKSYLLFIPLIAFALIYSSTCRDLAIKLDLINIASIAQVLCAITITGFIFLGGFLKLGAIALTISYLGGYLIGCFFIVYHLRKAKKIEVLDYALLKSLMREYKQFPMYQMPAYFINNINVEIPSYFIRYFYGYEALGNYFMAARIVNKPLSLISDNISGFVNKHLSEIRSENVKKETRRIVFSIFGLCCIFYIFYAIFGKTLFFLVLPKDHWGTAFLFSNIIIISAVVSSSLTHFSSGLLVLKKNNLFLIWEIVTFLTAIFFLGLTRHHNILQFLWLFVTTVILRYLVLWGLFEKENLSVIYQWFVKKKGKAVCRVFL